MRIIKRNQAAGACIKIVERVMEKNLQDLVNLNEIQFRFIPGKRTVDAIKASVCVLLIKRKPLIELQGSETMKKYQS